MKRLLVALLMITGCRPGSSGAEPDPRLGVLFAQNEEVNALPNEGSANFVVSDFDVDSRGAVHFIAAWGPTRQFGSATPHFNSSRYWRVTKDGKVEEKAGPKYASAATTRLAVQVGSDDQPSVVQYDGLGAGKVISFFAYDAASDSWSEKPLFYSERPDGMTTRRFGVHEQVRVLGGGQYVVQLENRLLHSTTDGWAELARPPGAIDLKLVNADDASVRVVWTEAGNRVGTATYSRSTWAMDAKRTFARLSGVPKLGDNFNVAGSPQAFTLDLDVDAIWMTYRFTGTTLSRVDTNGLSPGTRVPLLLTRHPTRALRGYTTGVFEGRDVGKVGTLQPGVISLTCPPTSAPATDSPFPDTSEARKCSNRPVDLRMKPEPDLSGMVLVTFDRTQDIVTRGYVKHVPFPVVADPFFGEVGVNTGAFPGDDGGTDLGTTNQSVVTGRVVLVGQAGQSGVTLKLFSAGDNLNSEPVDVADDGTFTSGIKAAGAYRLEVTCSGFVSQTIAVTVTQGPSNVGTLVLDAQGILEVPFDPAAQTLGVTLSGRVFQLSGGTMTMVTPSALARKVVGTNVSATPAPIFTTATQLDEAMIGWVSGGVPQYIAPGYDFATANSGVSLNDFRLMGASAPVVATGPIDGVTPRDWKQQGMTLVSAAVDVAYAASNSNCTGLYKWVVDTAGDGGIRGLYRVNCASGAFAPLVGDLPTPPLNVVPSEYRVTVLEGTSCGEAGGYLNPCKLFVMTNGTSLLTSSKAVDYRPPLIERVGSVGTAYTATGALAGSNLALPSRYAIGERPAYALSGGPMLIRTTTGFTFLSPPQAPLEIAANVIRSFEAPGGVAFYSAAAGATDCSAGCTLELLTSRFNQPPLRTHVLENATGDETAVFSVTGWVAYSTRTWPECPDAPCPVVTVSLPDAGSRALTRGAMAALPVLPAMKPAIFLRFNPDGGAAVPSTYRP